MTTFNREPPAGFQGLDPDKPVTFYMRHLPHWRQDGATYFVTFRLHDSLPQSKLHELERLRQEWLQRHPPPHTDEQLEGLMLETMCRVEHWLDQGMGSCRLKDPAAARIITDAMHYFDGARYELDCYTVMPNHVHCVLRPLLCNALPLEKILQSWKRHSALEINRLFGLEQTLWQEEGVDRIIRDAEHLYRVIQYIGANPIKAGLSRSPGPTPLDSTVLLPAMPSTKRLGARGVRISAA